PKRLSATPQNDVSAAWVVCTPQTIPNFSAVLYFFGREIHKAQNVPVGLIAVSWGGSSINPWISTEGYETRPELKDELEQLKKMKAARTAARNEHLKSVRAWLEGAEKAAAAGQEFPDAPPFPTDSLAQFGSYAAMYNGMVHGLVPYALRGFLWYQG